MIIRKYVIKGLVQGIGYRPFVAKIADELNIDGWVRNTGGIVTVLAAGTEEAMMQFKERFSKDIPTGGFITAIEEESVDETPESGFKIVESDSDVEENLPLIPADIATCGRCQKELLDPNNRRYRHPFISCTVCGPRYSIIEKLPYDRDTITMADFKMCPDCQKEYTGLLDRRRHAQTIACKACGPKIEFIRIKHKNTDNVTKCGKVDNIVDIYNENDFDPAISRAVALIQAGGILAIKDIGGYHLACNPFNDAAVKALRILKHREAKAFAVMFNDMAQVREFCITNEQEENLLKSIARPIVLLRGNAKGKKKLADSVCLSSPDIGAMLPCNPVQILLTKECGPLIMTSGNASGDVLEIDNDKMKKWLQQRVDSGELSGNIQVGMLAHDRRILRPMDDSVMKVVRGRQQFVRRGRGHVPNPIPVDINEEIFAAGGDLKSSFCYTKNGLAYVSQYLGDLESVECQKFYQREKSAMSEIFGFKPKKTVVDAHPGYFSSRVDEPVIRVQHHRAHVAAVIAEHHLKGQVLGFAFDGTGYGDDGTIWGSEVFKWDGKGTMERVAHLKPVKLIGGDEGARNCDTILTGILHAAGRDDLDNNPNAPLIRAAIDNDINTVFSTSMGRWFDAMSAYLDVCHYNSYEGQAPVELEWKGELAKAFIYSVADFILEQARKYQIKQVVLSGGTFLNRILLERTIDLLEENGFQVYIAEQLPPGDGGICLGQAYLASIF